MRLSNNTLASFAVACLTFLAPLLAPALGFTYQCNDGVDPYTNGCCYDVSTSGFCPSSCSRKGRSSYNGAVSCSCSSCDMCSLFECPLGFLNKADAGSIEGADKDLCCDDRGTCDAFSCPAGWTDINSDMASVSGDDEESCCTSDDASSTNQWSYTCDDGINPFANGCCYDISTGGLCPSTCSSKGRSSYNGAVSCSCSSCEAAGEWVSLIYFLIYMRTSTRRKQRMGRGWFDDDGT